MATQGNAVVNFGTGSGSPEASVAVTGQAGLTGANLVEAWALCNESVSGLQDDGAKSEMMNVYASNLVAGTGFTIYMRPMIGNGYGSYNVGWVWN